MTRKRRMLLLLALAAAVGGGGFAWLHRGDDGRGAITLYGNVDVRTVDLAFDVEGPVQRMLVEEGAPVKAGQLLARLDRESYEHAVAQAEAAVAAQRAVVARFMAGSRPAEIEQAKAAVVQARVELVNARQTYDRQIALVKNGFATQQAVDDASRRVQSAEALLRSAKESLSLWTEGPRREDKDAARAQLAANEATLRLAQYRLKRTELYAPADGTILTRIREPGAVAMANTAVYTLAMNDPVWVRTYVAEPQLGKVFHNQRAEVITDSAPNEPYPAWVGFISPTAEFTPKAVETPELRTALVYRLRVYVRNPDRALRQGMPVTVRLFPEAAPGVLESPPAGAADGESEHLPSVPSPDKP